MWRLCAIVLSLALISTQVFGQQQQQQNFDIVVQGQGATFAEPVYAEWLFAYTLLRPEVKATYAPTGSSAGIRAARTGTDDFGGSDAPATASDRANYPWVTYYPTVAGQIALLVNIPGVATERLNISRNAAAGIFSGNITRWDHPEILNKNPSLSAAQLNSTITVVVRKEGSGTTSILTTALNRMNSTLFPYASFQSWPTALTSLPNFLRKQGSTGVSGEVQSTPFTIGYAVLSFATQDSVPVTLVENRRGQYVSPYSLDASSDAVATITFDPVTNAADLTDADADGIYPLLGLTYILINAENNTFTDCERQREVLKIFRWAFTQPVPRDAAAKLGYVNLPSTTVDYFLGLLSNMSCDGEKLLNIAFLEQHTSALFEVLLTFSMLAWIMSMVLIAYSWWSSSRSKNPLFYAACLMFGTSLAFCSTIFFYLVPDSTAICELRKWLLAVGLTVLLGVMFARGWQLHALKSGPRVISTLKLLVIVAVIAGIQLIILICWSAIDTWESHVQFPNEIDLEARYECHSDHSIVWLLLELGFFLVLLGWGIYVVYATWRNRSAVDSRWTLIAVYNTLIVLLVIIPLIATAVNSDDWVFYVAVLGTDFAVLSCIFSIYGSAVLRRIWDSVGKSSTSGDSGDGGTTKVSSLRMTVGATVNS